MTLRPIFARRVREWRVRRDLTVRALAQRLGVSAPFIVKVERGDTNPTLDQVERFASALNIHDPRKLLR